MEPDPGPEVGRRPAGTISRDTVPCPFGESDIANIPHAAGANTHHAGLAGMPFDALLVTGVHPPQQESVLSAGDGRPGAASSFEGDEPCSSRIGA